jgi:hypothetical protein
MCSSKVRRSAWLAKFQAREASVSLLELDGGLGSALFCPPGFRLVLGDCTAQPQPVEVFEVPLKSRPRLPQISR